MSQNYDEIRRQADHLHHRCRDFLDETQSDLGRVLEHETLELREDAQSNRPPRTLEDRIKRIQRELRRASDQQSTAMDARDAETLFDEYENLRRDIRELPDY